ncbi:hypothetical protein MMPV_000894 [Pyropia vietnamensis]
MAPAVAFVAPPARLGSCVTVSHAQRWCHGRPGAPWAVTRYRRRAVVALASEEEAAAAARPPTGTPAVPAATGGDATPSEAAAAPSPRPQAFSPRVRRALTPDLAVGYAVFAAAQAIPFVWPNSGNVGDVLFFLATASSALYTGAKGAAFETDSVETLTPRQAATAPIGASFSLFGAYCLLRYTDVNVGALFNVLTTSLGALCLKEMIDPVTHGLLPAGVRDWVALRLGGGGDGGSSGLDAGNVVTGKEATSTGEGKPSPPTKDGELLVYGDEIVAWALAVLVTVAYLTKTGPPSFLLSNVIAGALCARVLAFIRPESFLAIAGLLTGLLAYDIFWVWGTEVMVSVAVAIDAPAKFLFPRVIPPEAAAASTSVAATYPFAVLGAGDVIVPGVYAAFCLLALDKCLVYGRDGSAAGGDTAAVPAGPYFRAALAAYVAGLAVCFGANMIFHAAQPALVYLVPALISSTLLTATTRGEFWPVVRYKAAVAVEGGGQPVDEAAPAKDKTDS